MGRKVAPTKELWFVQAVCHPANNVEVDEEGVLWVVRGGKAVAFSRYKQGLKFFFLLSCGKHYRYCTAHTIKDCTKLLCPLCERKLLKAVGMAVMTALEIAMHSVLLEMRVADEFVPQVQMPFWAGQLDFWHPYVRIALQVDGPHHVAAGEGVVESARQYFIDARMVAAACGEGVVVVRVRDLDIDGPAATAAVARALEWRDSNPTAPLVVLGRGLGPEDGAVPQGQRPFQAFLDVMRTQMREVGLQLRPFTITKHGNLEFQTVPL